ncbi:adenylate/guanylate cyclase domain-containing protein [Aestuariivirga sp.]|uniref:adenylate/guanylate cyclase domain-containing protein n=1 Tax=Aestuariivirga sp. TaxID=2650926 RepID=UPI0039E3E5E8
MPAALDADDTATVAFIDLAGFSAITDVYGDTAAVAMLQHFEGLVRKALGAQSQPVKWIGDEVMLAFTEPRVAIRTLGELLSACRTDERLPLTRTSLHHGPVVRRDGDLFGATVKIAARLAALAAPGQLIATQVVADAASAEGIAITALGAKSLRSLREKMQLYEICLTHGADPAWIDPVCKMHAPYEIYQRAEPVGPWFCSKQCGAAYHASPETYGSPRDSR